MVPKSRDSDDSKNGHSGGDSRGEFKITLDRREGAPLGIEVDYNDGETLLLCHVTGGLVGEWNRRNPAKPVEAYDRIVEVNGHRCQAERMLEECRMNQYLEILVQPHL